MTKSCIALQPETYRAQGWEVFSSSELCASCHFCLPLSTLSLQAVPPALLRCAEELLLGTAVSLHQGPLSTNSLCPMSLAQLSSTAPAKGTAITPLGALLMSPRASGTQRQLKTALQKCKSEASFLQCPPEGQH